MSLPTEPHRSTGGLGVDWITDNFAQGLLDPEGHVWKAIRAGVFDPRAYKPYRADRTYQDAYRRDYRDMIDLGSHAQIYLDPRMIPHTRRITQPNAVSPSLIFLSSLRRMTAHATWTH